MFWQYLVLFLIIKVYILRQNIPEYRWPNLQFKLILALSFCKDTLLDKIILRRSRITEYTISTRTVDNYVNVNETWVNSTATTSKKVLPIMPVANFSSNITEGYAPLDVQFNDSSLNATHLEWN